MSLAAADRVHFPAGRKIARHLLKRFWLKFKQGAAFVAWIDGSLDQTSLDQQVDMPQCRRKWCLG